MYIAYVNDPYHPQMTTSDIIKAASNVVPLAKTMKKKIDSLRDWARTRARLASSMVNIEEVDGTVRIPMTSREIQEDIF